MTNLLTRRLALFRIASVAGASAVATAPIALAAVQPKTPENPELLAVGQSLIAVADECVRLAHVRAEARAKVMSIWPALPPEIAPTLLASRLGLGSPWFVSWLGPVFRIGRNPILRLCFGCKISDIGNGTMSGSYSHGPVTTLDHF
jgi:hypothetical protein